VANRIYPAALPNPATLLGWDGTDFRALLVDSSAHLQADVLSVPAVNVQQASGDKFWGFHGIVEEGLSNTALAAGTNVLDGTAVPTGEIWQILCAGFLYLGTVPTGILLMVQGLAGGMSLLHQLLPGSGYWYSLTINVYLQVGDYMQATVYGATLNDDMYFRYAGLKRYAP